LIDLDHVTKAIDSCSSGTLGGSAQSFVLLHQSQRLEQNVLEGNESVDNLSQTETFNQRDWLREIAIAHQAG
jgi:hypothetical protein